MRPLVGVGPHVTPGPVEGGRIERAPDLARMVVMCYQRRQGLLGKALYSRVSLLMIPLWDASVAVGSVTFMLPAICLSWSLALVWSFTISCANCLTSGLEAC